MDKDNYLSQVVRYIHLNPLGAGLVGEREAYMWSSHQFYLRPRQAPKWLRIEEVMSELTNIRGFHEFVPEGNAHVLEEFYKKSRQSPVLGNETFRDRLIDKAVCVDREHPPP